MTDTKYSFGERTIDSMTTQPVPGGLAKSPEPFLLPHLLLSLTLSISSIWSPQILPRVAVEAEKATKGPQFKSYCGLSRLWDQGLFCLAVASSSIKWETSCRLPL